MTEPMISIVVPIYNIESYIDRCVESLLVQTYKNIEIILIDDGSTDKSGLICDSWREKSKKVKVIHKNNGGLSDARNKGIECSNGQILSFIDGDDAVNCQMYQKLVRAMNENDADISMCRMKRIEFGKEFATREFINDQSQVVLTGHEAMELLFLDKIDCSVCVKIFKKELFHDVQFPLGKTNEDFWVLYRLFHKCKKIIYTKDMLYQYYCRPNSVTKAPFNNRQFDKIDNCMEMYEFVKMKVPELKMAAKYYLLLQTMYLLKTMTVENIIEFNDKYIELRKIIIKNTAFILKSKYLSIKEKLMYLCLGWVPKIYKIKHT